MPPTKRRQPIDWDREAESLAKDVDATPEQVKTVFKMIKTAATVIVGGLLMWILVSPMYTIDQTEIGVVTRFGKTISTSGPGLHWKLPIVDSVHRLDLREQTNGEEMEVSIDRMPVKAKVSINWRVDATKAADFYGQYKTLKYFEENILDRMVRDSTKAIFPQYSVDGLLKSRTEAGQRIDALMDEKLKGYPVAILRAQIEDVGPPADYLNAVREKEKARERAAQEQYELERQKLQAERDVQAADAAKRANILKGEGEAQAIRLVGDAKAEAALKLGNALKSDPSIVQYKMMEQWNGTGPTYATSMNPQAWFSLPAPGGK